MKLLHIPFVAFPLAQWDIAGKNSKQPTVHDRTSSGVHGFSPVVASNRDAGPSDEDMRRAMVSAEIYTALYVHLWGYFKSLHESQTDIDTVYATYVTRTVRHLEAIGNENGGATAALLCDLPDMVDTLIEFNEATLPGSPGFELSRLVIHMLATPSSIKCNDARHAFKKYAAQYIPTLLDENKDRLSRKRMTLRDSIRQHLMNIAGHLKHNSLEDRRNQALIDQLEKSGEL